MIKKLNWDSDFFGYEIGKFRLTDFEKWDFKKFKNKSEKYRLVYVFSKQKIEFQELDLVDTKLTFEKTIKESNCLGCDNIKLFKLDIDNFKTLEKLALASGVYSRFKLDRNFRDNEYKRLYKEWIKNSVYGQKSMAIIIYKENNNILGFTTLEQKTNNLLDIGLVAVNENARGKRIGSRLIEYSANHGLKKGFNRIQVVTQQNNLPAVKLYEKCGFKIKSTEYIYHYWNL